MRVFTVPHAGMILIREETGVCIEPSKIGRNQQSLSPQTTIVDLGGVIDDIFTRLTSLRHSIFPWWLPIQSSTQSNRVFLLWPEGMQGFPLVQAILPFEVSCLCCSQFASSLVLKAHWNLKHLHAWSHFLYKCHVLITYWNWFKWFINSAQEEHWI